MFYKKANSFVLFGRAFLYARKDFWVSIQVLLILTIIVAIVFFFVEHTAQSEEYKNPWQAFVWQLLAILAIQEILQVMDR